MKALFIILNQEAYLDDILSIFVKSGVKGATIIDSQGMASAIVNGDISSIPLFGSLKSILKDVNPYNKTIFSVIQSERKLQKVVKEIQKLLQQTNGPIGFMFTVPVGDMYSLS